MKSNVRLFRMMFLIVFVASVLAGKPLPTLASASESVKEAGKGLSPQDFLRADGTLDLSRGFNGSFDLEGWDVAMDPHKGPIFARAEDSSMLTQTPAGDWANLGGGLPATIFNGDVNAIVVVNGDVVVGGDFTDLAENPAADSIAKWDALTGHWLALGSNGAGNGTLNNVVYALAVDNSGNLYVGGAFRDVDNNGTVLGAADYIAKWDGTDWSALGSDGLLNGSLNNAVTALAVDGGSLYVGGQFTNVNNRGTVMGTADYIAKWDGSDWSSLGSDGSLNGSLNGHVYALAVDGLRNLYVGGAFTNVNNNGTLLGDADYIARWNTVAGDWSALGSDGAGNGSLNSAVRALVVDGGANLYVGGYFSDVNNNGTALGAADYVAMWDPPTGSWSALGSNGSGSGSLNDVVNVLAADDSGNLYIGGYFTSIYNGAEFLNSPYFATWDLSASIWQSLVDDGSIEGQGAVSGFVAAVAVDPNGNVYVGGRFINVNGLDAADYVAKWDPQAEGWSALGSDASGNGSLNYWVNALAVDGSGNLYVGGQFTDVKNNGTVLAEADRIAKWDPLLGNWSALGSNGAGNGSLNNGVTALAVDGSGSLYVGGGFTDVNNNGNVLAEADYIAKWDPLTGKWLALGSDGAGGGSLHGQVNALAMDGNGNLYAGGFFTDVNNNGTALGVADYIAKWDPSASSWSALGSNGSGNGSLNSEVYALALRGTSLYAGGRFYNANNNGIALPYADDVAAYGLPPIVATLPSVAAQDGWILESSETSNLGGTKNSTATTMNVGDSVANQQYRSIFSFDTTSLPDTAVITSVTLKFRYAGKGGRLPFTTHGKLLVDVLEGAFKNSLALQSSDFNAKGTLANYKNAALSFTSSKDAGGWYSQSFNPADFTLINLLGPTQLRLRFTKDDNNDFGADLLKIYSGNANPADRPQLIVEYYIP